MQQPIVNAVPDLDWVGNVSDTKFKTGVVIIVNDTPVSWKSKKQVGVSLPLTESEYVSICECVKAKNWVRMLLEEINMLQDGLTVLHEDNAGAIRWSSGDKMAKHVYIRLKLF